MTTASNCESGGATTNWGELGTVAIEWPSGSFYPETSTAKLLHDVDETTFENVFAIGLHELQELGTLNDTEAAKWLYSLSAGIDRVSLVEVLAELQHSRSRILASDEQPSQVRELLNEHNRLQGELAAFGRRTSQYGQLIAERAADDATIAQLEQAIPGLQGAHRTLDAAVTVHPLWLRRSEIERKFRRLGPTMNGRLMPPSGSLGFRRASPNGVDSCNAQGGGESN